MSHSVSAFCSSAKGLLKSQNIEFTVVELDREGKLGKRSNHHIIISSPCIAHGSAMQDYLEKRSGQRTVPNIFIKQQHIGGCDDLKAADRDGRLQKMLAA